MDSDEAEDIVEREMAAEKVEPIEVSIKKEKDPEQPSFDYDDYSPSDTEILEIEKEIQEKIEKRTKHSGT